MELSLVYSRAAAGMEAPLVHVETHLSNGLPAFSIVGMPETAVRESKDRVRSALLNSHFQFPDRRITINLAPADLPKEGGRFDLPIALGILAASGQLPADSLARGEFVGELALDGKLRPVPAIIPAVQAATGAGRSLATAPEAARLAAHVPGSQVFGASDLLRLCAHLNGRAPLDASQPEPLATADDSYPDLCQVFGQPRACRALEVAASGGHHLLLSGPPGTGKTLLACRLPGILPALPAADALTVATLHSFACEGRAIMVRRPFRQPHHSASAAALVGGGSRPRPGEISLAHAGVLFLDELPEFSRHVLDMLREPMEAGDITLSRARHRFNFPARFQLVAAMNPCPCGYLGDRERPCRCPPDRVLRYRARLPGPLLDRFDLLMQLQRVPAATVLAQAQPGEPSARVRARVTHCRERQLARQSCTNAALGADALLQVCRLDAAARRHLERAATALKLSVRALHRSLRVARTLADMAGDEAVTREHLGEALAYRAPGEEPESH